MGLRLGNLDKKLICICNLNSSRAASSGEFKFKHLGNKYFQNLYQVRTEINLLMNTTLKILLLVIVVVLLTNTVISDRLFVELNPDDNGIDLHYGSYVTPVSADSVIIDLKAITLLLCIGLVGVVVFARQRIRNKNNE